MRYAEIYRETSESRVQVVLDIDGGTKRDISTGIGFFDHMLNLFAFRAEFDIGINAEGDLVVDDHHTVEDVGIVLGQAFREAMKNSEPTERYGNFAAPMDEALVLVALDISGRGALYYDVEFSRERLGGLSTENIQEFFKAFATHSGITLHIRKLAGTNEHHICEAIFKGVGLALKQALTKSDRPGSTSTKGKLD
ncbi:MAG: imidazoleglycerol-phosphate dehydratase HisB [Fimbriimonas sp.]